MASAGKLNALNGTIPKATPTRPSHHKRNRVNEVLTIPPPPPLNISNIHGKKSERYSNGSIYFKAEFLNIKQTFQSMQMQLIKLDKLDNLEKNLENVSDAVRATKQEIDVVRQENHNLITKVANLEKEVIRLKADKNDKIDKLEKHNIDLQARSMRDNRVFYNIQEMESVEEEITSESLVLDVIKSKLSIAEDVRFERVHRMGSKFSRNGERRIRPIVAKFSEFKVKEKVRKNAFTLAGTNVGIAEQFPPEIQAKRKELWPIMKKVKQDGKRASMVKDKLYIDRTLYRPTVQEEGMQQAQERDLVNNMDTQG